MPGGTPELSQFYQLWGCRERLAKYKEETITQAVVPLFHDQIEKTVHAFDGTMWVFWGRGCCYHAALLGCGCRRRERGTTNSSFLRSVIRVKVFAGEGVT
jgi:hypothetical protein